MPWLAARPAPLPAATPRSSAVPSIRPPAWISAVCLGLGAVWLVAAWVLAFLVAPALTAFFYQPRALAVVHAFTLGWISLTMIGVLYQYVPSLTKRPLTWPRAAPLPVVLFALGAAGLVRLALTYGLLVLVGWISNYIVGIGSRMAPGLMGLGPAPLLAGWSQPAVFWLLNGGVAGVAVSIIAGSAAGLRLAVLAPLAASLLFMAAIARRVRGGVAQ